MTAPRRTNVHIMAKVLAETVAELSDPIACRHTLAFVGFTDEQMNKHLSNARNMARHLRINEIEQRVRKELQI